ncbi:MAG: hypothetical protein V3U96_10065 [Paracoccaceae bacterium]
MTDKMVYVVPTLAAASFFAASLSPKDVGLTRSVDDGDVSEGTDSSHESETGIVDE